LNSTQSNAEKWSLICNNSEFDNYQNAVENNNLLGALKGVGSSQMPPSGAMNACNQRKIARWVAAGMPQ
jgi:hypothetical protein